MTIAIQILLTVLSVSSTREYDATAPSVVYDVGGHSRKAKNWWDKRPHGQLFAADEGGVGEPHLAQKGGL